MDEETFGRALQIDDEPADLAKIFLIDVAALVIVAAQMTIPVAATVPYAMLEAPRHLRLGHCQKQSERSDHPTALTNVSNRY